jgi:hypothetical protein
MFDWSVGDQWELRSYLAERGIARTLRQLWLQVNYYAVAILMMKGRKCEGEDTLGDGFGDKEKVIDG